MSFVHCSKRDVFGRWRAAAAVAIVISGKSTTEYYIWNNTHQLKSAYLVSVDTVLHLSVLMEVWISEHSTDVIIMTRTVTSLEDPQHSFLCESHGGLSLLGGELTNCRCGINAASLCEKGYSQPLQVLPLPVWDDASTQIIHVNKFM